MEQNNSVLEWPMLASPGPVISQWDQNLNHGHSSLLEYASYRTLSIRASKTFNLLQVLIKFRDSMSLLP